MGRIAAIALPLVGLLVANVARADSTHKPILWDDRPAAAPSSPEKASAAISNIIFLNRCANGCTITKADNNNSLTDQSWLVGGTTGTHFNLPAFAWGDTVWQQIVDCVKDVYSPYNVVVTDVDPGQTPHTEVYATGLDSDVGLSGAGGVGGSSGICTPVDDNVAFAFLNGYQPNEVEYMCGVIAQETGHSFGMPDHVRDCTDPMSFSYYGPCSGSYRGYFRNREVQCGSFGDDQPPCTCGGERVNDHVHLMTVFGAGSAQPPAPTVSILAPQDGATITADQAFSASFSGQRGIFKVEVYLNGWLWGTYNLPDHLGPQDSFPVTNAVINVPNTFPDGKITVEMRAYDDLGTMASATVHVTKGAACTSATTCLKGQDCTAGACQWAAPTGQIGDACTYDQQCVGPNTYDGQCVQGSDGSQICTESCFGGPNDLCPTGFQCLVTNTTDNTGECWFTPKTTGCCSTGGETPLAPPLLLGAAVGALVLRRRRASR